MKKLLVGCLILASFTALTQNADSNCLNISNFAELGNLTSFDATDFNWTATHLIKDPSDLTPLHNERIKNALGIDGTTFLLHTGFDHQDEGLFWETVTVNSTGRAYDIYVYTAGDNGSGFIYEAGTSDRPAATISDGLGGEISGCLSNL